MRVLPQVLGLLAQAAAGQQLYDYARSPLVELTDANFEEMVVKDTGAVWVVEFYADWCGHCKSFAKGYEKAAENLKGIVKFGAVNAGDQDTPNKAAGEYGVQSFPTVKIFAPQTSRNPYTGKAYKEAADYKGPRTARGMVDGATKALPSHVVEVTDKSSAEFRANGSLPKALLFTDKRETTPVTRAEPPPPSAAPVTAPLLPGRPLFKSLALRLQGRLLVGEARQTAAGAIGEFGVESFPALFVRT